MATKLDKAIRRELEIGGTTYTITLSPEGLKVVPKGKRKGIELDWERILRGDVTLGQDLKESLDITME